MTLEQLRCFIDCYRELCKLSKRLHKYYELQCIRDLTEREPKNLSKQKKSSGYN